MSLNPLPIPEIALDQCLQAWLQEDIGRGDWTTAGLGAFAQRPGQAVWVTRAPGVMAGLPFARRLFQQLDGEVNFEPLVNDGDLCPKDTTVAKISGSLAVLLSGERVALNLVMRLSGIATATQQYVEQLAHSPTQFVDTRKTTPGLRQFEKYASRVGGAINHRMGLDDAVMIKDNHIAAAGGIRAAVAQIRSAIPYPMMVEVETSNLEQVEEAIACPVDIIMLDNMPPELMKTAVGRIREQKPAVKIEASGNVTLETLGAIAATGVDFISSSAPVTRAPWLDISMQVTSSEVV
ncbi:carboxylating nicotinate-nucleotide diphosphorylase [Phormidium tenue]|uniref:Probable nicotinate-nucleotide pyrophosphorylase [carboxylating] n=1 Tax=Phormidium tenue NIES-30 TaxID=549789 RepID=A0A1U7J0T9_9CYAN|nr:carboxylating nicotinate-nucleotide diphosphorylase [Phormidium tenue]MBD2233995.1 carboxylating nicotinate-nucleotide diphosphorylase [Phormidium tenue FACHB-1052]OKH45396.1 nicotinate-nucleotide diphosphorylase (carboxylating) [Phormidium tenue NIES-30]